MKRYSLDYVLLQKNISIIQHHTEGRVGRRLTFRGILVRIRVLLECVPNKLAAWTRETGGTTTPCRP
jgi:hypothetical protein